MSNKNGRTLKPRAEATGGPVSGQQPVIEIGPATLNIFQQVLVHADISKAQIVTLLEAKGQAGHGNYRLVIYGARLIPSDPA